MVGFCRFLPPGFPKSRLGSDIMTLFCAPLIALLSFIAEPQPSGAKLEWSFVPKLAEKGFAATAATPPARGSAAAKFSPANRGGGIVLNRSEDVLVVAKRAADLASLLPRRVMSVSAWVSIERSCKWGGIICCMQDDGGKEKGFVLGYGETGFCFGLSTRGADDGDGHLSYLRARTGFTEGRWHHVAGTYDGKVMRLYVDGKLDAETEKQSGEILYEASSPFVLGSYRDANEDFPLDGRLLSARLESRVWSPAEIKAAFERRAELGQFKPWTDLSFGFLVKPYLTWPRLDGVSILFETTWPSSAEFRYRRDDESKESVAPYPGDRIAQLHECRLRGLRPDQKYFYRVLARGAEGEKIESPLLSFRTAASPDKAFTFVVVGDTQTQGDVAKRVSDLAWMHRPNLILHAGDLVDVGRDKRQWTDIFFPSMQPLIGRVPLMPVLGNHEQDAAHYYNYMSLPAPERWYSFRYGNAEFFMIDGNRSLAEQSAQLRWLEGALGASQAVWRFAVLHQPPFTSDSNDYGNTWKTSSHRGDRNVRNIVKLLEVHGVDICFSGHVHDYERTFPIRKARVCAYEDGGVIYVTAAGGGGRLEDFDPANTWFGHKKARYHHLVYIAIHGEHLEFQAIDQHGRLFDTMTLRKRHPR